jgi:hypothetical protein
MHRSECLLCKMFISFSKDSRSTDFDANRFSGFGNTVSSFVHFFSFTITSEKMPKFEYFFLQKIVTVAVHNNMLLLDQGVWHVEK